MRSLKSLILRLPRNFLTVLTRKCFTIVKPASIDEKIDRQKAVVLAIKKKYDAALAELDALQQKKKELQGEELLKAFANSNRSLDEVISFMQGQNPDDDE